MYKEFEKGKGLELMKVIEKLRKGAKEKNRIEKEG